MKIWIAGAAALLLACGCSASKEAAAALTAMNLDTPKSSPMVQYGGKSGNGDTITLNDVTLGGGSGDGLKAKSLILGGLNMTPENKPILTSITLRGITPETAMPQGMRFMLDSISIEGLNAATGTFLASSFTDKGAGDPPPFAQWGFSKVSINGLKFDGDFSSMGAKGGKFNVGLGELSVSNLKDTVIASGKLTGLKGDVDVPAEVAGGSPIAGKFDFGAADIKNIRGGVFADAFGQAFNAALSNPAGMSTVEADIMKNMSSPLEGGFDEFTWTGVNAEAAGAKFVVSPVSQKITRDAKGIAIGQTSSRTTLTLSADASAGTLGQQVTMLLSMVGYPSNTIEFYGQSDASYDPATDTTRYKTYNFGLTDGFDVKATGGVQGLTKFLAALMASMSSFEQTLNPGNPSTPSTPDSPSGPAPATPAPAPASPDLSGFDQLKVVDLDLTLTDKSFVNLLLGIGSMFGGGDPAALRNDVVNMLKEMGPDLSKEGVDASVANELMTAVSEFVKRPGSLNIKLKPAEPLALSGSPDKKLTKQQLGFSATYTPSPAAPAAPAPAAPKPN